MKSFIKEIEDKFIQIEESDIVKNEKLESDEEIEEQNVTGAVAGYNTPAAFAAPGKWKQKSATYEDIQNKMDEKYQDLIESYRKFMTSDPKISPAKKVNNTIREIAKKLHEIETLVNYNSKLKTEAGITSDHYGNSTRKSLHKISERLIKIAERVRSLGE